MRSAVTIVLIGVFTSTTAAAQPYAIAPPTPPMVVVAAQPDMRGNLGGGFIEFLFGDGAPRNAPPQPVIYSNPAYANTGPTGDAIREPQSYPFDPRFLPQRVDYQGSETPGTIVIDTPQHFLYLVEGGGKAMRYGIGVGRPGFT